jgi:hypothetical protein
MPTIDSKYSDDQIESLYSLGRHYLKIGSFRNAEIIFRGIVAVRENFFQAHLALIYLLINNDLYTEASLLVENTKSLFISEGDIDKNHFARLLLLESIISLNLADFAKAGTALGEVHELIENHTVDNADLISIFRSQLVRYQSKKDSSIISKS